MDPREVFSLILVAAGSTALGYSFWLRFRVRQSRNWPTTTGQIILSEKSQETLRHGHGSGGGRVIKADVRYRFSVDGREYEDNTVCIGHEIYTSFPARADHVLARYPLGAEVGVHYNPENPADACLERRSEAAGVLTGAGLALLILSFIF